MEPKTIVAIVAPTTKAAEEAARYILSVMLCLKKSYLKQSTA